jgi:hypothetical protein
MGLSHFRRVGKRTELHNIISSGPPASGGHVREGGDTWIARRAEKDIMTGKNVRTRITPSPLTKSISIFLFATLDVM